MPTDRRESIRRTRPPGRPPRRRMGQPGRTSGCRNSSRARKPYSSVAGDEEQEVGEEEEVLAHGISFQCNPRRLLSLAPGVQMLAPWGEPFGLIVERSPCGARESRRKLSRSPRGATRPLPGRVAHAEMPTVRPAAPVPRPLGRGIRPPAQRFAPKGQPLALRGRGLTPRARASPQRARPPPRRSKPSRPRSNGSPRPPPACPAGPGSRPLGPEPRFMGPELHPAGPPAGPTGPEDRAVGPDVHGAGRRIGDQPVQSPGCTPAPATAVQRLHLSSPSLLKSL